MSDASIPVDLLNPGQVFACLGFAEAADVLCGSAEGIFDWSDPREARFRLRSEGEDDPFAAVLGFLAQAEVTSLAPHGSDHTTQSWQVLTCSLPAGDPFPFPDPDSPATLPASLSVGETRLVVDHWGDATRRDNVKFWAGAAGYPGAALVRDALGLARDQMRGAASDPFSVSAVQSSSFRFDWRRDYIPIDTGFSLNVHGKITPRGYPLVELMAALGLSNARPERIDRLEYRYGVVGSRRTGDELRLPLIFLRAALGCAALPFPARHFRMNLGWPGQEGQARCITTVSEENAT